jgi:hypothetical protein
MTAAQVVEAPASPWTTKQRLVLVLLLAVGVIGLVVGYTGTSGTLRVGHQVPWINLAGAALLISGVGVVVFLTVGRRAIGRRRLSLFGDVVEAGTTGEVPTTASAADLVSAPTMTKYHRRDCSFVADKRGLVAGSTVDHEKVGRRACGVCLPGGDS